MCLCLVYVHTYARTLIHKETSTKCWVSSLITEPLLFWDRLLWNPGPTVSVRLAGPQTGAPRMHLSPPTPGSTTDMSLDLTRELWIWIQFSLSFLKCSYLRNLLSSPCAAFFFNPPHSLCLFFFFSLLFFLLLSTHEKLNFWDPADDNVVSFFLGVLGIRWCQLSCIVALVLIFKQLCHDWFLLSPASPSLLWTTLITTVPWLAMGEFWTSLSVEWKLIKLTSFLGESCQEGFLDATEQLIALKGHRNNLCVEFCLCLCDHIASIYKLPR